MEIKFLIKSNLKPIGLAYVEKRLEMGFAYMEINLEKQ